MSMLRCWNGSAGLGFGMTMSLTILRSWNESEGLGFGCMSTCHCCILQSPCFQYVRTLLSTGSPFHKHIMHTLTQQKSHHVQEQSQHTSCTEPQSHHSERHINFTMQWETFPCQWSIPICWQDHLAGNSYFERHFEGSVATGLMESGVDSTAHEYAPPEEWWLERRSLPFCNIILKTPKLTQPLLPACYLFTSLQERVELPTARF